MSNAVFNRVLGAQTTISAKAVLLMIARHSDDQGFCNGLSISYIGWACCISEQTAIRAVKALVALDLIASTNMRDNELKFTINLAHEEFEKSICDWEG